MRLFSRLALEQNSLAIKSANMTARSITTVRLTEIFRQAATSEIIVNFINYTSRGHVCGFYGKAILFGSKARKQALS